jgi:hypothetical protein
LSHKEGRAALEFAKRVGLNIYRDEIPVGRWKEPSKRNRLGMEEEEIIIEKDGKVFFRHLTDEFLDIAATLEPANTDLKKRRKAFLNRRKQNEPESR